MKETKTLTRGMVLLFGTILLVILIAFISFKILKNSSVKKYRTFENELIVAAENYYEIKNVDIDEGEEKKITIKQLSNMNLVYNELANKCDGYVVIASEENISTEEYEIAYRPYIKCGKKYMTANYSEY